MTKLEALALAVQSETARRCAEIAEAEQTADLKGEPMPIRSGYRSAATCICILIRREFGLLDD